MKNSLLSAFAAAAALASIHATAAPITGFGDITFWVGNGSNQAGLVVDFHDGKTRHSFAWGYRWDGAASGAEMIAAVSVADPHFTIGFLGTVASGFFLQDIAYFDGTDSHFAENDFGVGVSWGYYLSGGSAYDFGLGDYVSISGGGSGLPALWSVSPSGASNGADAFGRALADGAWDAWSFGTYDPFTFEHEVPPSAAVFAAVPEPSAFAMIAAAMVAVLARVVLGRRRALRRP